MTGTTNEGIKTVLHPVTDLDAAKAVYTAVGFSQMVHAPELGGALYLAKELR